MTDHTRTENIGGDSILFCGHPSRAGNRYDNGLIKQCLQDIFIFKNLMIYIVCRHYVHVTHFKFLQETDQMISTGRDLVFFLICLDKYQLGFTLSYIRAAGF